MSDELANIGEDGRRFRAFFGVLCFFFALGLTALLTVSEAPSPLRLVAFMPAWLCMLLLFQARESTYVLLTTKGVRSIDSEDEIIDDLEMAERLRAKARRIHVKSLAAALFYTILLLTLSAVVPWRIPLGS